MVCPSQAAAQLLCWLADKGGAVLGSGLGEGSDHLSCLCTPASPHGALVLCSGALLLPGERRKAAHNCSQLGSHELAAAPAHSPGSCAGSVAGGPVPPNVSLGVSRGL